MTVNNFEEYDDPVLYDKENESYTPELSFLLKWALKKKGPIIDLACGTGRLTIPMAKSGYQLIGVDIHRGMLNEAIKKASDPKEMERVLFSSGFEIVNVYSDWNETPVTNDSYEMIYVCQKIR